MGSPAFRSRRPVANARVARTLAVSVCRKSLSSDRMTFARS